MVTVIVSINMLCELECVHLVVDLVADYISSALLCTFEHSCFKRKLEKEIR